MRVGIQGAPTCAIRGEKDFVFIPNASWEDSVDRLGPVATPEMTSLEAERGDGVSDENKGGQKDSDERHLGRSR
jgi:hypothetical protein